MTVSIRCPKCKNLFDSQMSYDNHLPCNIPAGASSEEHVFQEFGKADGDDQRTAS